MFSSLNYFQRRIKMKNCFRAFVPIFIILFSFSFLTAQSFNFPTKDFGISIGNSKNFTGLRINFRDRDVEKIKGINISLWYPKENKDAEMTGINLGLYGPSGGTVKGINIGGIGVGAEDKLSGFSAGLLGVGAGGSVSGITIGGLGAGAGGSISGLVIGGLGAGCGGDITGICIGGLGAGAGGDLTGLAFGLFGVGAGGSIKGITIGGLGAGAGKDALGFNFGLLGVGAGENMTGINVGGIGVGAGRELKGINIGGIGAGSPSVKGLTIAGIGAGGERIQGITIAAAVVKIEDGGQMTGFSASAFNYFKGTQTGVTIGIVNYAYHLNGIQIGLINYVRDNPRGLKILPLFNAHFD